MLISGSDAKAQLTDLARRAEASDEIIVTRHGHRALRLVPIVAPTSKDARCGLLQSVRGVAAGEAVAGPGAARSHDFLFGDDGLPG